MLTRPVFQLSYLTPAGHKKIIVHTYRNQSSRQIASLSLSLKEKKKIDCKIYLFIYFLVRMAVNSYIESILRNLKDIILELQI